MPKSMDGTKTITPGVTGMGQARGKKQKTVLLHDDLCGLLEAHEGFIGANFTRIITAAVLQYIFSDLISGPHTEWMSFAVALDRGDLAVADIPAHRLRKAIELAQFNVRLAQAPDASDGRLEQEKARLDDVEQIAAAWKQRVDWAGDPIGAIRELLTDSSRWLKKATPVYRIGPGGEETVGKYGDDEEPDSTE